VLKSNCLSDKGSTEEALAVLQKLVETELDNVDESSCDLISATAWANVAIYLQNLSRYSEAIDAHNQVIDK
jgi:tetratricopeptide (TPR) repeat protein